MEFLVAAGGLGGKPFLQGGLEAFPFLLEFIALLLESIVEVVFELLADLLLLFLLPFELFAELLDSLPCLVELRRYLGGRALGFG